MAFSFQNEINKQKFNESQKQMALKAHNMRLQIRPILKSKNQNHNQFVPDRFYKNLSV